MPKPWQDESTGEWCFRGEWFETFEEAQEALDAYNEQRIEYAETWGEIPKITGGLK